MTELRHWYKWWPIKYRNDESLDGWPLAAHGLYRLMLDKQWERERLPTCHKRLGKLLGYHPNPLKGLLDKYVKSKFVDTGDGFMYNETLEDERQAADAQSVKKSESFPISNFSSTLYLAPLI